jgi:cytoskeletal protein CcmA (bactofilin family)
MPDFRAFVSVYAITDVALTVDRLIARINPVGGVSSRAEGDMGTQELEFHPLDAKASNGRDFDYQLPNHASSGVDTAVDELLNVIDEPESPARPAAPPSQMRQASSPVTGVQMTNALATPQAAPVKQPTAAQLARGAHLYAGHGLKLKGEITDCETFTVEGDVEAHLCAKQFLLANSGTFKGSAIVEEAQIEGSFEGELHVTGRLLLRASGRVAGTISYGHLEIERGGQIHGHISPYVKPEPEPKPAPEPVRENREPLLMQRVVEQPARAPEPSRASAPPPAPAKVVTPRVEPPKVEAPKVTEPSTPAPEAKKRSTLFGAFRVTAP